MTTLAKYFKPKDLKFLADFSRMTPRPEGDLQSKEVSDWYTAIADAREEALVSYLMKLFAAKLKAGELRSVPNIGGREVNFATFWDSLFRQDGELHHKKWAVEQMQHIFERLVISPDIGLFRLLYEDGKEPVDLDKLYDEIVAYFDAGNFAWYSVGETMSCGITGEYLSVQFENWVPVVGSGRSGSFVPCVPIVPATEVQTVSVEFKTGDLVAMDWFRDSDGTLDTWLKARGADKLPSISSEHGICANTRFHAELGIVYVFVGNSSPNVFSKDGMIAVGNNWREYTADMRRRYSDADDDGNESEEAYEEYENAQENPPAGMVDEGRVCTDLWWVTMMDRSLLAEIMGEEYAAGDFNVEVQVEPGKYTLHFDGHPSTFYERLDDKTKFCIGTPYFALTKDPA